MSLSFVVTAGGARHEFLIEAYSFEPGYEEQIAALEELDALKDETDKLRRKIATLDAEIVTATHEEDAEKILKKSGQRLIAMSELAALEEEVRALDMELTSIALDRARERELEKKALELEPGTIYIYQTEMDDKVCDECRGLNRQVYTAREVAERFPWAEKMRAMAKPQTHPNCRCRLETLVTIELI